MNSLPNSAESDGTTDPGDLLRCAKHGELLMPIANPLGPGPHTMCMTCGQEAIEARRDEDHRLRDLAVNQARAQERQVELERRIGTAGIPARFREFSFDTFPAGSETNRNAISTARTYANRWPRMAEQGINVLVIGPTGTGKTGLACSIANSVIREHAATALFMTAYAAVRHQRDTWGRKNRTEREALDDLVNVDLLILDEVGASVGSDAEMAMLFEVINGRYAARRPLILLSNLPLDDFRDAAGGTRPGLRSFLGERVIERFRDDGSFTLPLLGSSLRGPAASKQPPVSWRES